GFIAAERIEHRTLMVRRKKSARKIFYSAQRNHSAAHDRVSRQVGILRTETVTQPRTKAGAALQRVAAMQHQRRLRVLGKVGLHRSDDAKLIHLRREVRKQFTHWNA